MLDESHYDTGAANLTTESEHCIRITRFTPCMLLTTSKGLLAIPENVQAGILGVLDLWGRVEG